MLSYEYTFSEYPREFDIVIVTGLCRSGKTLFSRLISSNEKIEYIDEPWTLMTIPLLQAMDLIDKDVARKIMNVRIDELMNDIILLRQANFRPNDLSTIWQQKTPSAILTRLIGLQSRQDVRKYIKENKPVLLCVLTETNPFIPFLFEAFPKCKIIHMIRHPIKVALGLEKKKWYSRENLRTPSDNALYRKMVIDNSVYYIPWWVQKGEENYFLGLTEFAKGLYYWRNLLNQNIKYDFRKERYKEIKFEDLIENKEIELANVAHFLKFTDDFRRNTIEIKPENKLLSKAKLAEVPLQEISKINEMLDFLNYSKIEQYAND